MANVKANITQDASGEFYALVVREQKNGFGGVEEVVLNGYKGRHFKTRKAAETSTAKYIAKVTAK